MRIAVFTGSHAGPPSHAAAAGAFARDLAAAGVGIVYGGGHVGLMGVVADAALAAGGEVVGVIPQHLLDQEVAHRGLTRLEVVQSMHERKALMADLADAFVALPGAAVTGSTSCASPSSPGPRAGRRPTDPPRPGSPPGLPARASASSTAVAGSA